MEGRLQVAIAHGNVEPRDTLYAGVTQLGHTVCILAENRRELVMLARTNKPDLCIVQEHLPDNNGLQAVSEISDGRPMPTIIVIDENDGQVLKRSHTTNVLAVLQEPVRQSDLAPVIPLAMHYFAQRQYLQNNITMLQDEIGDDSTQLH